MLITNERLNELRTPGGGITRAVYEALGVPYPLRKGWRRTLVGSTVSDAQWERAKASRLVFCRRPWSEMLPPLPSDEKLEGQVSFLHALGMPLDAIKELSRKQAAIAIKCKIAELTDDDYDCFSKSEVSIILGEPDSPF